MTSKPEKRIPAKTNSAFEKEASKKPPSKPSKKEDTDEDDEDLENIEEIKTPKKTGKAVASKKKGDEDEERSTEGNQHVRPHPRRLALLLTLVPQHAAQDRGNQQS